MGEDVDLNEDDVLHMIRDTILMLEMINSTKQCEAWGQGRLDCAAWESHGS